MVAGEDGAGLVNKCAPEQVQVVLVWAAAVVESHAAAAYFLSCEPTMLSAPPTYVTSAAKEQGSNPDARSGAPAGSRIFLRYTYRFGP